MPETVNPKTGVEYGAETGENWMKMIKKRVMELLLTFCMVTTGSVFVCAVYINVFWSQETLVEATVLWQILALSFLCSLGNFFHPDREISRSRAVFNKGIHYLYINAVVLGGGYLFGWMDVGNVFMLAVMILGILLVFITVSAVVWSWHKRETAHLNQKLQEYQAGGGRTV